MTAAILTFILTLGIVLATYWTLVVRHDQKFSQQLRERLQVRGSRPVGSESVIKGSRQSDVHSGPLGRIRGWYERYTVAAAARLIESAGMRTDPHWLVGGTAIAIIAVQTILQIADAGEGVRLLAGAATPLVPYFYIRHAATARLHAFEEMFPDAINLMSRALRAGHALTATLAMVAEEMDDPIKSEFRALHEQHTYGLPFTQVMRTFAKRVPLVDVRFFATAVLTQRETGGNLAEVLDNLANVMRDRFRVRRQVRVITAQGRMSGWILGALPIVVAIGMYLVNPEQMHAFIADPTGWRLLEIAVALEIAGAFTIRQILRAEY